MTEIVRMQFGSHLYGTATENSDQDFKAIHLPRPEEILLGRSPRAINTVTKLDVAAKNTAEDVDFESFSLQHFMKLLCDGQTVILDMLFCPPEMVLSKTWHWDWIRDMRRHFISKKCDSYIGYCRQQANKYGIKGSRVAAARTVVEYLKEMAEKHGHLTKLEHVMGECPMPEYADVLQIEIKGQERTVPHLSVCNRKVPFGNSLKEAINVYQRFVDEYGKRALMAESNDGVDWKALSHAVRIGRQAITVLGGEDVVFPLPYADHLLKIKRGELPYRQVAEEIDALLPAVEEAAANSTLPEQPNIELAEWFVMKVYQDLIRGYNMPPRPVPYSLRPVY